MLDSGPACRVGFRSTHTTSGHTPMDAREWPIGVVLSVTDGRLMCEFADLHEFIEWMSGEPIWTHQISRVVDEIKAVLVAQHPWLAEVDIAPFPDDVTQKYVESVLAALPSGQRMVTCRPVSAVDHTSIHPLDELAMNHPDVPVVAVVPEADDDV